MNLAKGTHEGIALQIRVLESCGSETLNYRMTKVIRMIVMRMARTLPASRYDTNWIDEEIKNQIPFYRWVKLFHSINRGWIFPSYAAFLSFGPTMWHALENFKVKLVHPALRLISSIVNRPPQSTEFLSNVGGVHREEIW